MIDELLEWWSSIPDFKLFGYYFCAAGGSNRLWADPRTWGIQYENGMLSVSFFSMHWYISKNPDKLPRFYSIEEIMN